MPALPKKFEWLSEIGVLPKLISTALQYLGIKEFPGVDNNPVIMEMAKGLGVDGIYTDDSLQAWCAVFINHCIRITGKPINLHPADLYDLLRALKVANEFHDVPIDEWKLGDVMRIKRKGGGHTFFPIAKTNKKTIWGLGGNQSNMVTFSEFDESRIEAVKRYYSIAAPQSAKQYTMDSSGKLSTNEA